MSSTMISDEAAAAETYSNHTDVKPADDDDAICCLEFLSSFPNVSFQKKFRSIPAKLANTYDSNDTDHHTVIQKWKK